MDKMRKDFLEAALVRAIRTAAQTALSLITVGVGIEDISWSTVLSVSLVSAFASILTSIVSGLPEVDDSGMFIIDDTDPEKTKWTLQYNGDPEKLTPGDSIRFKVVNIDEEK